jgi:pimeloyl-ACP methyl ester carboxylesterase
MTDFYESDGTRLGFQDRGSGQPVIFLHPTPLDHRFWLPVTEHLKGVRAIIPDLRGHGASELGANLPVGGFARVPDAPVLTMAQLAADILALMDHLHVPEAIFAGCSIGGYVLMELWRKAADRVLGMAMVCSKPHPDAEANLTRRATTIAQARERGVGAIFDGMAQTLVGATARAQRPEIVAELRTRMTLIGHPAGFRAGRGHHRGASVGDCGRRRFRSFAGRDGGFPRRTGGMRVSPATRCRALCGL